LFSRGAAEEFIDLPLPQDLQVRVRFVQQEDRPWIDFEMREQQKGLLHTPS